MTDFRALLSELRRPQMLIRAARCGLCDYRRDRDLRRLLQGQTGPPRSSRARLGPLLALMLLVERPPWAWQGREQGQGQGTKKASPSLCQ